MANTTARRPQATRTATARRRPAQQPARFGVRRTPQPATRGRLNLGRSSKKTSGGLLAGLLAKAPTPSTPPKGKGALVGGGLALAAAAATAVRKRKSGATPAAQYTPQPDGLPNEPTRPVGTTPPPNGPVAS